MAPAHQDEALLHLAGRLQRSYALPLGATGIPLPEQGPLEQAPFQNTAPVAVAVSGPATRPGNLARNRKG